MKKQYFQNANNLCPEYKLLLKIFRKEISKEKLDIFFNKNTNFDWDKFANLASRHNMMPYVFKYLINEYKYLISEDFYNNQKKIFQNQLLIYLQMTHELLRINKLLEKNDIEVINFKGIVLSKLIYYDINLREACDIDIFIKQENVIKSIKIFTNDGYNICENKITLDSFEDKKNIVEECNLINRSKNITIDLHWSFGITILPYLYNMGHILERTVDIKLYKEEKVKTFNIVDSIVIYCTHLFDNYSKKAFCLKWLLDITELSKNLTEQQWHELIKVAKENGKLNMVLVFFSLAESILDCKLPSFFKKEIRKRIFVRLLSRELNRIFFREENRFSIYYLLLLINIFDRNRDKLKYLIHITLLSKTEESSFQTGLILKLIFKLLKPVRKRAVKYLK